MHLLHYVFGGIVKIKWVKVVFNARQDIFQVMLILNAFHRENEFFQKVSKMRFEQVV